MALLEHLTMELNPKNEALTQLREHWQKILLLVMHKQGIREITLDLPDIEWLAEANARGEMPTILTHGRKDLGPDGGFTLHLCDNEPQALELLARLQRKG